MASYIARRKFLATLLGGRGGVANRSARTHKAHGLVTSACIAFLGAESASTNHIFISSSARTR
jgi:hypothetical protein